MALNRQLYNEARSQSFHTFDPYPPPMGLDNLPGDDQPQASSAGAARPRLVHLIEDTLAIRSFCDWSVACTCRAMVLKLAAGRVIVAQERQIGKCPFDILCR